MVSGVIWGNTYWVSWIFIILVSIGLFKTRLLVGGVASSDTVDEERLLFLGGLAASTEVPEPEARCLVCTNLGLVDTWEDFLALVAGEAI